MKILGRTALSGLAIAFLFSAPTEVVAEEVGPFIEFQDVDVWHQGGWCIQRTTWIYPNPGGGDVSMSTQLIC